MACVLSVKISLMAYVLSVLVPLGAIGRLCSVTMTISGHLLYLFFEFGACTEK